MTGPLERRRSGTRGSEDSRDSLEFYQRRVAAFGLVAASISLAFFVFDLLGAAVAARFSYLEPARAFHAAGVLATGLIWLLCRRGRHSKRYVHTVEAVGFVAGCVAYEAMGFTSPLGAGAGHLILFVLSMVAFARAVYVPSTPLRTLMLGLIAGLPLAPWTYLGQLGMDPVTRELVRRIFGLGSSQELAVQSAAAIAFSWLMATLLATGASQVIYGLRREAREAHKVGQYTLEEKLGEGGMGVVYRASHAMLRRPTAIKLLPLEKAGETGLARFEKEVQLTAGLTHPHTVTIFDYGRSTSGVFYYAMELLDGASLEAVVAEGGALPPARVIQVLHDVASALVEAHEAGLIHRDIKPANIILCRQGGAYDFPKVVDFGLVKELEQGRGASLTQTDSITGTPLYMSPEAITAPETLDARSDLYSLGAVGYFALTGQHVFSGGSLVEICSHHIHSTPVTPSNRLQRPVPKDLESLILACLEKDPAARPSNAEELRERLAACADFGRWTAAEARAWWTEHPCLPTSPAGDGQQEPSTLERLRPPLA